MVEENKVTSVKLFHRVSGNFRQTGLGPWACGRKPQPRLFYCVAKVEDRWPEDIHGFTVCQNFKMGVFGFFSY